MLITKKNISRHIKNKHNKYDTNKYKKYNKHNKNNKYNKHTKYEKNIHKTLKYKTKHTEKRDKNLSVNKKTKKHLHGGSLIFHKDVEISYKKTGLFDVGYVYASESSPPTIKLSQLYKDPNIYIKGRGFYYILISVGGRDISLYKYINNMFVPNKTTNILPIQTSILNQYANVSNSYETSVNCIIYKVADNKNYSLDQIKKLGTNPIFYKGNYKFKLVVKGKKK